MIFLLELPGPIIVEIFGNLELKSSLVAASTCKVIYRLIYGSARRWECLDVPTKWIQTEKRQKCFGAFLEKISDYVTSLNLPVIDDYAKVWIPDMQSLKKLSIFGFKTTDPDLQASLIQLATKFPNLESFALQGISHPERSADLQEADREDVKFMEPIFEIWANLTQLDLGECVSVDRPRNLSSLRSQRFLDTIKRMGRMDAFNVANCLFTNRTLGTFWHAAFENNSMKRLTVGAANQNGVPTVSAEIISQVGRLAQLSELRLNLTEDQYFDGLFPSLIHLRNLKALALWEGVMSASSFDQLLTDAEFQLEHLAMTAYSPDFDNLMRLIGDKMPTLRTLVITAGDEHYCSYRVAERLKFLSHLEYLSISAVECIYDWWHVFLDYLQGGRFPHLKVLSIRPEAELGDDDKQGFANLRDWVDASGRELFVTGEPIRLTASDRELVMHLPGVKYDPDMIDAVLKS